MMWKDCLGQEVKASDFVLYASGTGMSVGVVLRAESAPAPEWENPLENKPRFTVVTTSRLFNGEAKLSERFGIVLHPQRLAVIDRDKVPADILVLLDEYLKQWEEEREQDAHPYTT